MSKRLKEIKANLIPDTAPHENYQPFPSKLLW